MAYYCGLHMPPHVGTPYVTGLETEQIFQLRALADAQFRIGIVEAKENLIAGQKFMNSMGYSAWMKEDYADNPGVRGRSTILGPNATEEEQIEEIEKIVKLAHDRGWQIGVHTIGIKATMTIVDGKVVFEA